MLYFVKKEKKFDFLLDDDHEISLAYLCNLFYFFLSQFKVIICHLCVCLSIISGMMNRIF